MMTFKELYDKITKEIDLNDKDKDVIEINTPWYRILKASNNLIQFIVFNGSNSSLVIRFEFDWPTNKKVEFHYDDTYTTTKSETWYTSIEKSFDDRFMLEDDIPTEDIYLPVVYSSDMQKILFNEYAINDYFDALFELDKLPVKMPVMPKMKFGDDPIRKVFDKSEITPIVVTQEDALKAINDLKKFTRDRVESSVRMGYEFTKYSFKDLLNTIELLDLPEGMMCRFDIDIRHIRLNKELYIEYRKDLNKKPVYQYILSLYTDYARRTDFYIRSDSCMVEINRCVDLEFEFNKFDAIPSMYLPVFNDIIDGNPLQSNAHKWVSDMKEYFETIIEILKSRG